MLSSKLLYAPAGMAWGCLCHSMRLRDTHAAIPYRQQLQSLYNSTHLYATACPLDTSHCPMSSLPPQLLRKQAATLRPYWSLFFTSHRTELLPTCCVSAVRLSLPLQ